MPASRESIVTNVKWGLEKDNSGYVGSHHNVSTFEIARRSRRGRGCRRGCRGCRGCVVVFVVSLCRCVVVTLCRCVGVSLCRCVVVSL